MQPIIYDVAISIDGYISGKSGDISRFPHTGEIVDDYLARLETYSQCLMGKHTYEFAYDYGLKPGQNPYPKMKSFVVSSSITLPRHSQVTQIKGNLLQHSQEMQQNSTGPIYLCGGGKFANSMLDLGQIDIIRLKRAPVILGNGTKLFGDRVEPVDAELVFQKNYSDGLIFQEFKLK